ncbi:MAG: CBS domain-containing protein [Alphaproteobacteria bacterium]
MPPRCFADRFKGSTIPWREIEPIVDPPAGVEFGFSHARLAAFHPADIAKLIDHLPFRQGARILCSLEPPLAADTLEEVERRRQPEILDYLPQERAVEVLNHMAPDAAADLLEVVPRHKTDELIGLLDRKVASDIRLLLSYPHNSAAGLMTTDFVIALESETVAEAFKLHTKAAAPAPILSITSTSSIMRPIANCAGFCRFGICFLAEPADALEDWFSPATHTTHPETHCKEVARIMGEYNLLALPVIDEFGRLLGLVTADDVLDLMLPESLRHHLPRLFS